MGMASPRVPPVEPPMNPPSAPPSESSSGPTPPRRPRFSYDPLMHARVDTSLDDPELFINRELSQLQFNRRVLEQAKDPNTPLLERLRFLTISSTNLDEFFEIRVSGHRQRAAFGLTETDADGLSTEEVLERIAEQSHALVDEQYRVLNDVLAPALAEEGVRVVDPEHWTPEQRRWIADYFVREVRPVLTPVGLDPGHPFPRIINKSLNFIVSVRGEDVYGRQADTAIVHVPRTLPRLLALPSEVRTVECEFVTLSVIIQEHIADLFPTLAVGGCHAFRVTRNSDLWVDEEEVEDLLKAVRGELVGRRFGEAVRLEVESGTPEDVAQFLLRNFELATQDLYRVSGPVNLHRLATIHEMVHRPELKYPAHRPGLAPELGEDGDLFALLREKDVVLHHPYESFAPVVNLIRQAAADPNVLAIKQTLYRTGSNSPIVAALIDAARSGKEVTAVIELRARFDEAQNIDLATQLQEAGANVVYGIVGYKTHGKMILVVRRETDEIRRYVHLGTGNYHTGTARAYTDVSYLSSNRLLGQDVHRLFNQLTGLGGAADLGLLIQAPFDLHSTLVARIEFEVEEARAGREGRIIARMNSLSEPRMIRALYRASNAGVKIDLIVRGICGLRPGIEGVSENIRVRSIVGRFLEHSRIYHFHAGGEGLTYLSSADWMPRNFFHRVEIAFPVEDPVLARRIAEESLESYMDDNSQAWELQSDGNYRRLEPGSASPSSAQNRLLADLSK